MGLIDLERDILESIAENLQDADNWQGTDELREALGDAIDEACFLGEYFTQRVLLPLKADVSFYEVSVPGGYPLYVKRAYLLDQERRLFPRSFQMLSRRDRKWLLSSGTPIYYTSLSPTLISFYPSTSTDGGAVELDLVCCPVHYTETEGIYELRRELEEALIHYGRYCLLMRMPNRLEEAIGEFAEYLKALKAHSEFRYYSRAVELYRLQGEGGENWQR